jgi:hypothetical protein
MSYRYYYFSLAERFLYFNFISTGRCLKIGRPVTIQNKPMRSANNVGNAGPHVHQTFLNDVFTFLKFEGIPSWIWLLFFGAWFQLFGLFWMVTGLPIFRQCFFILLIFWGLFTRKDHLTHHNIFKYIYFHDSYQ